MALEEYKRKRRFEETGNEIMALFDRLQAEGNTIIVVTHEHDIAEYAHRVVYIKDGVVERDEVSQKRVTPIT